MGLVDVLAEDGHGEEAVRKYIDRNDRKHNALQAIYKVRRRSNPINLTELRDIVEIWSRTALDISEMDLKKMLRLTAAQEKRLAHAQLAAQAAE
jgi:DSF synthase